MIQVLLAQFRILPVTAGSEELLKLLLEAQVKVYISSAVTLQCLPIQMCQKKLLAIQMGMLPSAGFTVHGKMYM